MLEVDSLPDSAFSKKSHFASDIQIPKAGHNLDIRCKITFLERAELTCQPPTFFSISSFASKVCLHFIK